MGVVRAQVQDGGRPFEWADRVHRLTSLSNSRINWASGGQGAIQSRREFDCRVIADFELHRYDGRDAPADQCVRHSAEGISGISAPGFASVEHGQPQARVVAEHHAQVLASDRHTPALLVGEQQGAAVLLTETSVAHVMQHVEGVTQQCPAQFTEGRCSQLGERERPGLAEIAERGGDLCPFARQVKLRAVDRF